MSRAQHRGLRNSWCIFSAVERQDTHRKDKVNKLLRFCSSVPHCGACVCKTLAVGMSKGERLHGCWFHATQTREASSFFFAPWGNGGAHGTGTCNTSCGPASSMYANRDAAACRDPCSVTGDRIRGCSTFGHLCCSSDRVRGARTCGWAHRTITSSVLSLVWFGENAIFFLLLMKLHRCNLPFKKFLKFRLWRESRNKLWRPSKFFHRSRVPSPIWWNRKFLPLLLRLHKSSVPFSLLEDFAAPVYN